MGSRRSGETGPYWRIQHIRPLFGVGSTREGRVRWTYRVGGGAISLGALLLLTTLDGDFDRFDPESTAVTLAAAAGTVSTTARLGYAGERAERD